MTDDPVFRVIFSQDDKIYELYAREIDEEAMMSFVCVGGLQFGEPNSLLVDPLEEKLRAEFQGVHRIYIPLHMILRIDEMEKRGVSKIKEQGKRDNIRRLPGISE